MPVKEFEKLEDIELDSDLWATVQVWLDRGDGIAVYENHDLSHPEQGHRQFVSYGSPTAQIEEDYPPKRLPDIGSKINWRYQLIGTLKTKEGG